jgi:hypothetical protein
MRFPIIKIKDLETGGEHIVGTDSHDMLLVHNGTIKYYNLQNGDGSGEYGTYTFSGSEDEMFGTYIDFVTFEELQQIYEEQNRRDEKSRKRIEELINGFSYETTE